jgi:uncharacterized protein (DUF1684 family)
MDFKISYFLLFLLIAIGCKQQKKYHDESPLRVAVVNSDFEMDILKFQKERNSELKDPETSPLPDRFRKDFESLDFFKADIDYKVDAKFVRTPEAVPFLMPTTTDRKSKEVVFGVLYFTLKGQSYELEVYQNEELILEEGFEDYLFLPFTDLTNGQETYTGGRYIDLRIPEGKQITLDFNKAYNPYCVYNKKYSCPLVPKVNHLSTRILAGVKDFKKE